ncbi:MAG TPA: hypothetical protein PKD59_12740 [Miltoncostaeaceae bacterium]|nr:hypothetical protein [Miltoncostaeaceae bacterium]
MATDTTVRAVPLPAGAEPPIRVFVNGEEWTEGTDFAVEGGVVRFNRTLRAQPPLGMGRKIMLAIGIGVYGDLKGDTLDLGYRQGVAVRTIPVDLRRYAAGSPPAA